MITRDVANVVLSVRSRLAACAQGPKADLGMMTDSPNQINISVTRALPLGAPGSLSTAY